MATDMATMKPDQERVKNLLLDTVTLLCKNSLQYENHLRVEGLLGVAVDDNDVFFLHISEKFQSDAYLERLAAEAEAQREKEEAEKERERKLAEAERAEQERTSQNQSPSQVSPAQDSSETTDLSAVKIKKEANDSASDDEDVMITGSTLNSPHSVAHPVSMVAGQRRAQRRPHSPSGFRGSFNQSQTTGETDYEDDSFTGDVPANSGYSHLDNSASFKEEGEWDEPPSKRPAGMSHPWPNLTGIGDIAAHAAHTTFQDSGESQLSGGDLSQPGCSTWQGPSGITGGQDSTQYQSISYQWTLPEKKFACETCGKAFSKKQLLRQHSQCHLGKSFRCDVCGQGFSQRRNLQRHKKFHLEDQPFKCPFCTSTFTRSDRYKAHMQSKH